MEIPSETLSRWNDKLMDAIRAVDGSEPDERFDFVVATLEEVAKEVRSTWLEALAREARQ